MRSRHVSEQYRRFACRAESIAALHVGALGVSTRFAASIVHGGEQYVASGRRIDGMASPRWMHRRGGQHE